MTKFHIPPYFICYIRTWIVHYNYGVYISCNMGACCLYAHSAVDFGCMYQAIHLAMPMLQLLHNYCIPSILYYATYVCYVTYSAI